MYTRLYKILYIRFTGDSHSYRATRHPPGKALPFAPPD